MVEATVKYLDDIRRTPWMGDVGPKNMCAFVRCSKDDVKFFTHIAKYGILRRIGTSHVLGHQGEEALFETREVK